MNDLISLLQRGLGSDAVLTEQNDIIRYLRDWSGSRSGRAMAVIRPADVKQVSLVLSEAHSRGIPVVPQSGNTGLAGGAVPDSSGEAILVSLERMNKIRDISASALTMTAEAGCILEKLHEAAETRGLLFPLNFAAKGSCMLGGNLSTNAGGSNVVRYGNARELCLGIEAVLPDGRILNLLSGLRKNNTGYDLKNLFIGAEGTLGVITAATMKLFPQPEARATAYVAVRSLRGALEFLNFIQAKTGSAVEAFEILPDVYLKLAAAHNPKLSSPFPDLPPYALLVEIGATSDDDSAPRSDGTVAVLELLKRLAESALEKGLISDAVFAFSQAQRDAMWQLRESALEVISSIKARIALDISLPLERIHDFVEAAKSLVEAAIPGALVNPIGHLGDGNLHFGIMCSSGGDPVKFNAHIQSVKERVLHLLAQHGGSFSAEHGIGTSKLKEMTDYKDAVAIEVMRQIKSALDPKGIMNPSKLLPIRP